MSWFIWTLILFGALFLLFLFLWLCSSCKRQQPCHDVERPYVVGDTGWRRQRDSVDSCANRQSPHEYRDARSYFQVPTVRIPDVREYLPSWNQGISRPSQYSSQRNPPVNGNQRNDVIVNRQIPERPPPRGNSQDLKSILALLQASQQNTAKDDLDDTKRLAQELILEQRQPPTEASLRTTLVIGVDATPGAMGGYCVNLMLKTLEYYVIKVDDFPWKMNDRSNPSEFEMKNLQLALAIWHDNIVKYKKFRIYTDNHAIFSSDDEFGLDAQRLLKHVIGCEGAQLMNEHQHVHINRLKNLDSFVTYIQPVDDFSRYEIERGIWFLCSYYGINKESVRGTHVLSKAATSEVKAWYNPTQLYNQKIQIARAFGRQFQCRNCDVQLFQNEAALVPKPATSTGRKGVKFNPPKANINSGLRRVQKNTSMRGRPSADRGRGKKFTNKRIK